MIREYIIKISDEVMEEEIADRPQKLVRCKDCKHAEEEDCEIAFHFGEKDDWFCADGEPKESGEVE